jgi:hypothetical protein
MHRPGIASVQGDRIVLDRTTSRRASSSMSSRATRRSAATTSSSSARCGPSRPTPGLPLYSCSPEKATKLARRDCVPMVCGGGGTGDPGRSRRGGGVLEHGRPVSGHRDAAGRHRRPGVGVRPWVTVRHWPIVSPMVETYRSRTSWPLGAPYMHLPASQRSAAILVSQRAAAERYGLHAHAASDGGTGDFNNNLTHRTPECPGDLSQLALAGRVNLFIGGGIERGHKPVHQTVRRRPRAYRSARSLGEAGDDCGVPGCHSPDALDQRRLGLI